MLDKLLDTSTADRLTYSYIQRKESFTRSYKMHERKGEPWSEADHYALLVRFDNGGSVSAISVCWPAPGGETVPASDP